MAKKQKPKKPSKKVKRSVRKATARRAIASKGKNKNLEALLKAQQITDILKAGNIEGQAILDSAGEQRPSDEAHVEDLLDKRKSRVKDAFDIVERKGKKARR